MGAISDSVSCASTTCQPQCSPMDLLHPTYLTQISTPPKWLPIPLYPVSKLSWHWSPSQAAPLPHHALWEALARISGPSKCSHAQVPALHTRVPATVIPGPCSQSHWRPALPSSKPRAVTVGPHRQAGREPTLHNNALAAVLAEIVSIIDVSARQAQG